MEGDSISTMTIPPPFQETINAYQWRLWDHQSSTRSGTGTLFHQSFPVASATASQDGSSVILLEISWSIAQRRSVGLGPRVLSSIPPPSSPLILHRRGRESAPATVAIQTLLRGSGSSIEARTFFTCHAMNVKSKRRSSSPCGPDGEEKLL